MELRGDHRIPAPRDQVWAALRSPDLLRQCLPGCKSVRQAKHAVTATVALPLDGLAKPFTGRVILTGFDGQDGGLLVIEGSYSYKGFGPRTIEVRLSPVEDGNATLLAYRAEVRAQAGEDGAMDSTPVDSPVILDAVQRLGVDFAARLGAVIAPPAPQDDAPSGESAKGEDAAPLPPPAPAPALAPAAPVQETQAPPPAPHTPTLITPEKGVYEGEEDVEYPTLPGMATVRDLADHLAHDLAQEMTPTQVPPGLRPMVWIPILVLSLLLLVVLIR